MFTLHPDADGAVAQVGGAGLGERVVGDVDDTVEVACDDASDVGQASIVEAGGLVVLQDDKGWQGDASEVACMSV